MFGGVVNYLCVNAERILTCSLTLVCQFREYSSLRLLDEAEVVKKVKSTNTAKQSAQKLRFHSVNYLPDKYHVQNCTFVIYNIENI